MIELRGLRKEFNGLVAVDDLDLVIEDGEFLCFLGPSGCGKTTTLRMIAGLETPTAGDVLMRGMRINNLTPQQRKVGFVFQDYALFWYMAVYDNLAFGLKIRGISKRQIDKEVREMAERFELGPLLRTKASRLGLSAMQRVAIARTLLTDPQVLLLDEPLNNIRPGLRETMRAELKRLQQQLKRTMIYVTHDQEEAMTLGDRILVMNAGRIEQLGTPQEIYQSPQSLFVAGFIGRPSMNLLSEVEHRTQGKQALLEWGGFSWNISGKPSLLEGEVDEAKLVLGIRPEHVLPAVEARRLEVPGPMLPAAVKLVQPLARKKIVNLEVASTAISMVVPGAYQFSGRDKIEIFFDPKKIHIFNRTTGKAILHGISSN